MNSPRQQSESGTTLILALMAMVIIGALTQRLLLYTQAYREATDFFSRALKAQQLVRSRIQTPQGAQRGCMTQTIQTGSRIVESWHVCSRGAPPFLANRPVSLPRGRVDYNTVFASLRPCPGELSHTQDGAVVTSPFSATTCHMPPFIDQGLAVLHNISCENLVIRKQDGISPIIIASSGSITCEGALTVSSSTLFLAGGDITITSLHTSSTEPISITLLSAHGEIVVGSVAPGLSLLALGRRALSVPQTPTATVFPLPPTTTVPISGIRLTPHS